MSFLLIYGDEISKKQQKKKGRRDFRFSMKSGGGGGGGGDRWLKGGDSIKKRDLSSV